MSKDPISDRAVLVQPVREEAFRRLYLDAGNNGDHVLFGTATEDPAVGIIRIEEGLKIG